MNKFLDISEIIIIYCKTFINFCVPLKKKIDK
jgi:hypothetical protein